MSQRVNAESLKVFCVRAFQRVGVNEQDARIAADILVAADLRGVLSHGVAHLKRYVDGLCTDVINPHPQERVVVENLATATLDADAGLGQPVSYRAMQKAIQKAQQVGAGFVTVRNSNHFGIAGYYAMMALEHDCIGLAMTNASPKAVPTFGRHALLGTNPIAVAAPASKARPFVLDMATTTVALGKIEIANQLDKPIPAGWAIDRNGNPAVDSHRTLDEFKRNVGGGLLPLGGEGELFSGYKGYGLAVWVETFTALLSGAAFASTTYPKTFEGEALPANIGHFFGAWRIDSFRPPEEFKAAMDDLQTLIKSAPKADGHDRIYIHGEKEFEATEINQREGIPLNRKVMDELHAVAQQLQIEMDF
ncbi:MAG: Ldh family oxidoreductase [Chloroflexi bacterium]|nr:Ldh family oxidoreductase [Chloroflexota bacterium]